MTLAEAKAELGYLEGLIKSHGGPAECISCSIAKGKRCKELKTLQATRRRLAQQIRAWLDPPPDQPSLI